MAASKNLVLINNSLPIKELIFTNCSASFEQNGFPCEDAMQEEGVGWAYNGFLNLPASITLELENSSSEISQLDVIASPVHANHWPHNFMFEFLKDRNWVRPNWVDIVEPDVGYFDQSTGEIEVDPTVLKTVIKFDPITDVSQVRLTIYDTSAANDNAVIEQIKVYGTFPDPGYHLQIPTRIG